MDADADAQLARVGAQLGLELLHHDVEGDQAIAREAAHGERVVLAGLRDAAGRHVTIPDRFHLKRKANVSTLR